MKKLKENNFLIAVLILAILSYLSEQFFPVAKPLLAKVTALCGILCLIILGYYFVYWLVLKIRLRRK